jgi:hypothetical protein
MYDEKNIRLNNVNLIYKWSVLENHTIVLLLLKMVEQYSNAWGSGIEFLSLEDNSHLTK